MNEDEIWREFKRRFIEGNRAPIDDLFREQKRLALDKARHRVAQTSRRSGKSFTAAAVLVEGSAAEGARNPYISLTRESARRIIWPTLKNFVKKYRYKCDIIESSLTIRFDCDSEIFLVGADQSNFIERLRGIKIKQAVIDEAQGFRPHLADLVDDVLTPALIDLEGQLTLFGTPHPRRHGYFFDVCHGRQKGWSLHKWTIFDNPYIKGVQKFLDELKEKRGWTDSAPTYQREYLNQWVHDDDAMLFKFSRETNVYSTLPNIDLQTIIGVDFGYNDKTAFVVLGENEHHRTTYCLHSEGMSHLTVTEIAERLKQLSEKFKPVKIVADTGSLGKTIAEEMRKRHGLPIHAAEKQDKASKISLLNDEFMGSNLKISALNLSLIDELETILRDPDTLIEDKDAVCDEADALLYAFTETKAYASVAKEPALDIRSEDFMRKQLELESEEMQNREWWE